MITQTYNLNLMPNKVPVVVNASQYDKTSRTLNFNIYNGDILFTIPSGSTVTVRGTKPDKTGFEYPCTFNGSVVSFNIQEQMTVLSGKIPVEIRIIKGNEILGTANFILFVEQTTLADDTIISETDLPLLESAEQNAIRAENAADRAEQTLANKQDKLTAGNGIQLSSNVISNFFSQLTNIDLDTITYYYEGYAAASCANKPSTVGGTLISLFSNNNSVGTHIFCDTNNITYSRRYNSGWSSWKRIINVTTPNLYTNNSTNASLPTGATFTQLLTMTLPAGRYVINFGALFSTNATGYRDIAITNTNTAPNNYPRLNFERVNAISGALTSVSKSVLANLTAETTFYLWGAQTSGATLTAYPYIQAIEV